MLNTRILLMAGAVLAAANFSSCHHKAADEGSEPEMTVDVAEVVVDSIVIYNTYPGTLAASSSVDLVARVDGYLTDVNYKGGDLVKKGQVLFRIEDRNYRDALAQAQAQLATARSSNEYATRQYEAMKKALESDAVSKMEVIQARSSMEESEASIKQAQAAVHSAETNLSYCTVRAPFTGHITESGPNPGAYLAGEGSPVRLATIYQDDVVSAQFFIADAAVVDLLTDPAERGRYITFDSIPVNVSDSLHHSYAGSLSYISPEIDTSTGTLTVKASIANPWNELRDGMYATIDLPTGVDPHAILVKDAALSTDQLGKYLYVVNDSNRVVYTPVKTGSLYNDTMRVVTSGLRPGDRYVTKALLKVRNGMTVKPVQVN